MTYSRWIREPIKNLERIRDDPVCRSGMFRMDRNERTWPHSEVILNEIRARINSETLTNYTEMDEVYQRLARHLEVSCNQLYFHSGSDLVIKSIFETYVEPGDKVLLQNPSYAMYGVYGRMYGAELCEQDYDSNLHFDIEKYCEKIEQISPKMVVLENPSGYIGNGHSHEQVQRVIETAYCNNVLIVVDEAYIDYRPDSCVQDLIPKYDNLIIVRTFSKAWGLAGMRAGYALSNPLLISEIFQVMPMHELTSATAKIVSILLNHSGELKPYIEEVLEVREYFQHELENLKIRYVESDTHFVTVCLGECFDADDFREQAHKKGYFVRRPFGQDFLKDWVRIGLLPMADMQNFVEFMKVYIRKTV